VIDGLKGIGEALGAVFPATTLQTCIVHLIRNSLDYASWKDRKLLAAGSQFLMSLDISCSDCARDDIGQESRLA
jgi:transposase-like protein